MWLSLLHNFNVHKTNIIIYSYLTISQVEGVYPMVHFLFFIKFPLRRRNHLRGSTDLGMPKDKIGMWVAEAD